MARHLVALKVFYRFLKLEERTSASAVELLSSPALWERIPQVLSPDSVEKLLTAPLPVERFCARDRAGEKPLYYANLPGTFLFASEPKAFLSWPSFKRRIHYPALLDFLAYGFVPDPKCIWEGCKKLSPGHCMTVRVGSGGTTEIREPHPWWDWTFNPDGGERDWTGRVLGTLTSGGDLTGYFRQKAIRYQWENRVEQKTFIETMGLMAETYVTAAVAGPLFLLVMVAIIVLMGSGTMTQLQLLVYLLLPVINLGFMFGLKNMIPEV